MSEGVEKPKNLSSVGTHFAAWEGAGLLALVKDLYEVSAAGRDFIEARYRSFFTAAVQIRCLAFWLKISRRQ